MVGKLITDEVMFNFNWDGRSGKHKLKAYDFFNEILYETWDPTLKKYSQFVIDMRSYVLLAHNRVNTNNTNSTSDQEDL